MRTLVMVMWCLTLAGCAVADRQSALSAMGAPEIGSQERPVDSTELQEDATVEKPTTTCTIKNGTATCF